MDSLTLCECFARDGLQHEDAFVPTDVKVSLIDAFTAAGFPRVEASSYSHPDQVPAFRDSGDVLRLINRRDGVFYKMTCPNLKAIDRAIADRDAGFGAEELSLLLSATDSHSQRNLKKTRAQQWDMIEQMAARAGGRFRLIGVISVALGCPFEGDVDPGVVIADLERFGRLGAKHITVGDTTGTATPKSVRTLFSRALQEVPQVTPIAHFHDTRGSAIANCVAAYDAGCRWFDSAMGGVGGHPHRITYGQGDTGNVATEDLVNLFEAEGVSTGLDIDKLIAASQACEAALGRPLKSRVARSGFARHVAPARVSA